MKKIILAILVLLMGIQFIPVSRKNSQVPVAISASAEVKNILKKSCYDCHSEVTIWPWYAYVAPVSWFVARHVNHGRRHLNFSGFEKKSEKQKRHAFKEMDKEIRKNKMPLKSYLVLHREARLNKTEKDILLNWINSQKFRAQGEEEEHEHEHSHREEKH